MATHTSLSGDGQALLVLAFVLLRNSRFSQALAVLEGLRELEPDSFDYLPLLCQVRLDMGLYVEALEAAQRLLKAYEGGERLCAARLAARALWGMNRHNDAKALLSQAVENANAATNA